MRLSAIAVAVLALVAAGCSSGGGQHAVTAAAPCRLDGAQRRTVVKALADIRRLRRIEAPLTAYSERGAPDQNTATGQFMVDLGSARLPLNVYSHLLHLAKGAVRLCGDCSRGLEAEEPFLGTRAHKRCG